MQLALADPSCAVIQELHYFEIVSLLVGVQLSLHDFLLRNDEDDWPVGLGADKTKLRNMTTYLDECLELSESMYGILTSISFLLIFGVSYCLYCLLVHMK